MPNHKPEIYQQELSHKRCTKIGAHLPIHIDRCATTDDELHDPSDEWIIKSSPLEDLAQEMPIQAIICLLEVQL
jgi:hypothetical protein